MDKTFDTGFDLNESTVVSDVGDFAEETCTLRVAAGDTDPGIFAKLLDTERNTILFLVELENLGCDFLALFKNFARMTYAAPCEVGDVQKTVDTAEVNECTVVSDVLNDALNNSAFLECFKKFGSFFAHRGFDNRAAGKNNVVALTIKLDNLEFKGLAFVGCGVLNGTCINEGTRQECADAVGHHCQAALNFACNGTGNQLAGFEGFFKVEPGGKALSFVAGQDGVAVAVFEVFDSDGNEVTYLDVNFAAVILEFFNRNEGFALQAGVNNNVVVINADNFCRDDFALFHFLLSDTLLE